MNAPLRKMSFEALAEPPLLRPEHMQVVRAPLRQRLAGAGVTAAAHIVAVAALVLGFHVAKPLAVPHSITVSVEEKKMEEKTLEVALPKFAAPQAVTAPEPVFNIAPNPDAIPAAPPRAAPATPPAAAAPGPAHDTGETRGTYLGGLLAHLNRFKHYPPEARAARMAGVVMLHFIMDRQGKVLLAEITKSSGRPALDREAMEMINRAQPLPAMPVSMTGDTLDAIVPVQFSLR